MKRIAIVVMVLGLVAAPAVTTEAANISLFEAAFNVDGTVEGTNTSLPGTLPGAWALGGFNFTTGLGAIGLQLTGAGSHSVGAFFDLEIDEAINTFYNEYGVVSVTAPPAGLSWEIDEPGYVFGDIYTNFLAGLLDNTNGVPDGVPDDVSVALQWDFSLTPGQTAYLTFQVFELAAGVPAPTGFYLVQVDPDSQASVYFTTSLDIRGDQFPEPATLLLLGLGLLAGATRLRLR